MSFTKVVLMAFGLAIVFTYAPIITLIAGAIILAVYNSQDIKILAGKSISFSPVLFLGFAIAVAVQAVLTIIFGASFENLVQAGGLIAALKTDAVGVAVAKEVFALIIVFCATYLVVSSPIPNRRVFKLAIGFSVLALVFQCWTERFPLKSQPTTSVAGFQEAAVNYVGARLGSWSASLSRDAVYNEHAAQMPAVYFATADAYLYSKDGESVKRGELVATDSRWFHLVGGETITDKVTGVIYEPVASYENETKTGWLRVDRLSKSLTIPKVAVASKVVPSSPAPVVAKPAMMLAECQEPELLVSIPSSVMEKTSNTVTVTTGQWVSTGVATDLGDRVEVGRFSTRMDIERLEVRMKDFIASDIIPSQTDDGRWCAILNFSVGGQNIDRHQIELRLKYGLPLNVVVQKI